MSLLSLGVFGTSRKENEFRLPLHPAHLERIDERLRPRVFLEDGYGQRFGARPEEIAPFVGGFRPRERLIEECDVILLPKPLDDDLVQLRENQVFWGWPHFVQNEGITQNAIDRKLTAIAWESMNAWKSDGRFSVHVFHKNNELAGYCSVLHALELLGRTGEYGRRLRGAVISFGATGRGAVTALQAMGIVDVTVLTHRDPALVESPIHTARFVRYDRDDSGRVMAEPEPGPIPIAELLSDNDVVVNCVLQDTDNPLMFVTHDELKLFSPGSLIVDVSCDEGMGFEWARPTGFDEPTFTVGDRIHYYAVDHSPSYLWDSSTWEISEALLPHLATVLGGPQAWDDDETIRKAIEVRDGVIVNEKILSFQNRARDHPHEKR